MTKRILPLSVLAGLLWLTGCGGDVESDPTYANKAHDDLYKNGSLVSNDGGFNLFSGKGDNVSAPGEQQAGGVAVNGFLWRAALDTISFMPILSADPFGGTILTDWYSAPDSQGERTKLNIFIRDRELSADGVKVSVFRQSRDIAGNWQDAPVAASTATTLENAILTRARQIRMAQRQFD